MITSSTRHKTSLASSPTSHQLSPIKFHFCLCCLAVSDPRVLSAFCLEVSLASLYSLLCPCSPASSRSIARTAQEATRQVSRESAGCSTQNRGRARQDLSKTAHDLVDLTRSSRDKALRCTEQTSWSDLTSFSALTQPNSSSKCFKDSLTLARRDSQGRQLDRQSSSMASFTSISNSYSWSQPDQASHMRNRVNLLVPGASGAVKSSFTFALRWNGGIRLIACKKLADGSPTRTHQASSFSLGK
eukprot:767340-Hanusia_phi.AAC.1